MSKDKDLQRKEAVSGGANPNTASAALATPTDPRFMADCARCGKHVRCLCDYCYEINKCEEGEEAP